MRVRQIQLREIHLELLAPFETSFGSTSLRRILLVEVDVDGTSGWGEVTAGEDPFYSYETVETGAAHYFRFRLADLARDGIWLGGTGFRFSGADSGPRNG